MATKQSKPRTPRLPPSSQSAIAMSYANWKDHPLAIAAVAVVATIGIAVVLITKIIIPTQTAYLTNQLTDLPTIKKEKAEADKKITLLEQQLAETQTKLLAAQQTNPFNFGNPYPSGFGQIRLGDPITKVADIYPANSVNIDEVSWDVHLENSPFISILYFYDEHSHNRINQISFWFGRDGTGQISHDVLKNKVTEALGAPIVVYKAKHKAYSWKVSPKIFVSMFPNETYYILSTYDLFK